ncbi:MAG: TIGR03067 domain-containing protein [Planctomycetaceae bacterium]|nr:TIGR03067 domain-containing protein [Planctomycetaceae bacterium]
MGRKMCIMLMLCCCVVMTSRADDARKEAIQKDRKRIEGTWKIVALEINGNRATDEDARKLTVINGSDGTWTLYSEGSEISTGTSTIDPTRKPCTINLVETNNEGKVNQYLGIYELGDQTRKLCFAPQGKERPVDFSSQPGSEMILVTFERVKTR